MIRTEAPYMKKLRSSIITKSNDKIWNQSNNSIMWKDVKKIATKIIMVKIKINK